MVWCGVAAEKGEGEQEGRGTDSILDVAKDAVSK